MSGDVRTKYYERTYLYTISGKEYKLYTVETNRKPYKTIRYNSNNPNYAETYDGINTEIVVCFIGLICIFIPYILNNTNIINKEKISAIKYKFYRISKKNILKTITIIFWLYMAVSIIFTLKEFMLDPNWYQILAPNSQFEIIARYSSKKY